MAGGGTRRLAAGTVGAVALAALALPATADTRPAPLADPTDVHRVASTDAVSIGVELSQLRFGGEEKAEDAVLSRDDRFPDALGAAALTADGPLLYTPSTRLDDAVAAELTRVLPAGATVHLLGGTGALSSQVEQQVRDLGFVPQRHAGTSRIQTALRVADAIVAKHETSSRVYVARAYGPANNPTAAWADSVSGSAAAVRSGAPILLTDSDRLAPEVEAWLREKKPSTVTLLGGKAALSRGVRDAIADLGLSVSRLSGSTREGTAIAVAEDMNVRRKQPLALLNSRDENGWLYGLAAAGLTTTIVGGASDPIDMPILYTNATELPAETADWMRTCTVPTDPLLVLGPTAAISEAVVQRADALDGQDCDPAEIIEIRRLFVDPVGDDLAEDQTSEHVELGSPRAGGEYDLSGWTLDNGRGDVITFPDGTTFRATNFSGSMKVFSNTSGFQTSSHVNAGRDREFLPNSPTTVTLKDATGRVIDRRAYSGSDETVRQDRCPAAPAAKGGGSTVPASIEITRTFSFSIFGTLLEIIELDNLGGASTDLTGWRLRDDRGLGGPILTRTRLGADEVAATGLDCILLNGAKTLQLIGPDDRVHATRTL